MKQLQNNFTTPEQSKQLLELGVPADSADMLWDGTIDANEGWKFEDFPSYSDKPFSYYQLLYRREDVVHILPCWSVGRLVEIYEICTSCFFERRFMQHSLLEDVLLQITEDIAATDECWDFSKLED